MRLMTCASQSRWQSPKAALGWPPLLGFHNPAASQSQTQHLLDFTQSAAAMQPLPSPPGCTTCHISPPSALWHLLLMCLRLAMMACIKPTNVLSCLQQSGQRLLFGYT